MIRHLWWLSSAFFFPACESQEWLVKRLQNKEKMDFEILFFNRMRTFAGAAFEENKTRFATDSVAWKQKRQRIGSTASGQVAKREMR
jgi:hypothetical protein